MRFYSRFPVGCPKIATRIRACAKFPIQNPRQRARMRRFSSQFLDNQLEIDCNLEIFLNLQGSEFIQTLLLIYNHLAKFVVYKSWTRSALLKGTSRCFLVSSITCRSKEAIEWVWSFFVVKLSTKPHPLLVLCFHRQ